MYIRKIGYRRWPVTVTLPVMQEDGTVAEVDASFIGHFKAFDEAAITAARNEVFRVTNDDDMEAGVKARSVQEQALLDAAFMVRLMCGWEQVLDEAAQPTPYSDETLTALMTGPDGPRIRAGLASAVAQLRFGVAPLKNVSTSPALGPAPAAGEVPTS